MRYDFCSRRLHDEYAVSGKWTFGVYKSFIDESGIEGLPTCVVAGYVGISTQFDRLALEWEKVLCKYDMLDEGFHSKEFYHPSQSSKVFGWSSTKREDFIDDLVDVINDRKVWLIGCGIDCIAFECLTEDEKRHLTGGVFDGKRGKWILSGKPTAPYMLALRSTLENAVHHTPRRDQCFPVMDRQEQYEGYAREMYDWMLDGRMLVKNKERLGDPISFLSRKKFLQLQAADLAAYHTFQFALERRVNRYSKPTGVFKRLVTRLSSMKDLKFVTAADLPKLLAQFRPFIEHWETERLLRATRLHWPSGHKTSDCTIIGIVDEGGNYHQVEGQDI